MNNKVPKVFAGGLSLFINESDLKSHFSKFGEIEKVKLIRDKKTKQSKCFAFISFKENSSIKNLLSLKEPLYIKDRRIDCQVAKEKREKTGYEEEMKQKKIFVGGIPKSTTDEDLINYFQKFGPVETAYVIKDYTNLQCKGFGFVIFEDSVVSSEVISMSSHPINGAKASCCHFKRKDSDFDLEADRVQAVRKKKSSKQTASEKKSKTKGSKVSNKPKRLASEIVLEKTKLKQKKKLKSKKNADDKKTKKTNAKGTQPIAKNSNGDHNFGDSLCLPSKLVLISGVEFKRVPQVKMRQDNKNSTNQIRQEHANTNAVTDHRYSRTHIPENLDSQANLLKSVASQKYLLSDPKVKFNLSKFGRGDKIIAMRMDHKSIGIFAKEKHYKMRFEEQHLINKMTKQNRETIFSTNSANEPSPATSGSSHHSETLNGKIRIDILKIKL